MALERRDHRVDIGPAGRNIFISRDKQLQSRQAKRIKVLMRLVMVLVGLVVAVGVGLFVALYMVPYFQAEISLDSSSSAQGGGLSSLSQVEMPTYDSMGLPVYDDDVALFVINQNNPQDASYVPNTGGGGGRPGGGPHCQRAANAGGGRPGGRPGPHLLRGVCLL